MTRVKKSFIGLLILLTYPLLATTPYINVDFASAPIGHVSASLLGVNNPMTQLVERAEFDTSSKTFPPAFHDKMNILNIRSLRFPGGNGSGLYHWKNGIGPYHARPAGMNGSNGIPSADHYHFGFLEFLEFLQTIEGSEPTICINFGTGSAREAATWVEFANAEVGSDPDGDGIDYALLRSDLGYPEPFGITFWEIGNELGEPYNHMFSWHFGQQKNGVSDYTVRVNNYIFGGEQWQYRDQHNSEEGQRVVRKNDWSASACISDGTPGQTVYMKYPPVKSDSIRLAVCTNTSWGEEWRQVDDLSQSESTALDFKCDPQTGCITFGDGIHGSIPPEGSHIRAIYKSVEKEGLIDFYHRMKQADPAIKIGVPFTDSTFHKVIAEENFDDPPFDFIINHPYLGSLAQPLEIEHWRMQWYADYLASKLDQYHHDLQIYHGGKKSMGICINETNHVTGGALREGTTSNPWYDNQQLNYFGRSLGNGLYVAGSVITFLLKAQNTGLWHLDHHSLVPDSDQNVAGWLCTALMGPIPFQYLNPSGHAYGLLTRSYTHDIYPITENNIPIYTLAYDDTTRAEIYPDTLHVPYLKTFATRSASGDTALLFVLNRASALPEANESHQAITARIKLTNLGKSNTLTFYEFNGKQLWDINSNSHPENVSTRLVHQQTVSDTFLYTFPPHSLTLISATSETSGLPDSKNPRAKSFHVSQNFPNPFNTTTHIQYTLPVSTDLVVRLLDILGREIRVLKNASMKPGIHILNIDMTNRASGIYILYFETASHIQKCKIMFMK